MKISTRRGEYVDMFGSKITGVGITCGQNLEHTFYLQFAHADIENNIDKRHLLELLDAIPEHLPIVIQNMMFEIVVLKSEFGVEFSNPIFDTKIMHSHVDEMSNSGLKDLSKRYLNYDQIKYADVVTKDTTMKDYTGAEIFQYGADDPLVTAHLFDLFYIILNVEGTWDFVRQHEFPTVNLLADSHVKGVSIDLGKCSQYKAHDARLQANCIQTIRNLIQENQNIDKLPLHANKWFEAEIKPRLDFEMKKVFKLNTIQNLKTISELKFIDADLLDDVVDTADLLDLYQDQRKTHELKIKRDLAKSYLYDENKELNLNSPKQMQELFYGMLGMPIRIRNPKVSDAREKKGLFDGEPQVNEIAIQEALAQQDAMDWKAQVLENLLKAKKAATRISLFYDKFPLWQHPKDGLIHPQFNSTGTESRRPSGSSPNFLQLSKKGDGLDVRRCILPNSKMGHDLICSLDWDGEELRAISGLSGDKELTACYVGENLKDVHSIVAAQIQGCSYENFVAIRRGSQGDEPSKKYDNHSQNGKKRDISQQLWWGIKAVSSATSYS
jgi:DNA polymerase I-like protein with 3'-5' exonuclease and polymerase domains